ncbi:MAG TPA: DUF922 domain-containing protein [Candidatus Saccharimonadales bacterium]|nr:DUF922 domain-containing protein [Candidatus Saccharimonadales bacterium]
MDVVTGPGGPGFINDDSKLRTSARSLRLAIDALSLCALVWGGLWLYAGWYQPVVPISVSSVAKQVATTVAPTISTPHVSVASRISPPPTITVSAPPQCAPDHTYKPAAAFVLSATSPGLHTLIDTPHFYRVYGDTSAQIRQQIVWCAPTQFIGAGEAYSGQTDFWMGWSYRYAQTATACQVTDVAVGLHVTQAYPEWQPTISAQPGLATQWQTFIANLKTHEQGHVSLGEQYAQTTLHDIQRMSAPSCTALVQAVDNRTSQEVAALNAANQHYDASTNHGATQGAILP